MSLLLLNTQRIFFWKMFVSLSLSLCLYMRMQTQAAQHSHHIFVTNKLLRNFQLLISLFSPAYIHVLLWIMVHYYHPVTTIIHPMFTISLTLCKSTTFFLFAIAIFFLSSLRSFFFFLLLQKQMHI